MAKGYRFSAYNWQLPAYNGAFLLTVVFGSFFLTIELALLTIEAFLLFQQWDNEPRKDMKQL